MSTVILDTEYTSWEGAYQRGWSGDGEHRELVQISAIKILNLETLNKTEFFSFYTKPRVNPQLSDYFINLTGISQHMVDANGVEIIDAINSFVDFSAGCNCLSWDNDISIIEENISLLHEKPVLRIRKNIDIRGLFTKYGIDCSTISSGQIDSLLDGPSVIKPGQSHNALSDCVSILSAITKLATNHGYSNIIESINSLG